MIKKFANFILVFFIFSQGACLAGPDGQKHKLLFFYSTSCHECADLKDKFIPGLEQRYRDKIALDYRDIGDIDNYKLLLGLKKEYGITDDLKVPLVFLEGNFLNGSDQIKGGLDKILEALPERPVIKKEADSSFDLTSYFLGFTPLAVIGAGLIDGINPCAFGVIVFFISFLALQGYGKKELILIGLSFMTAVFLTYLLIGLGFFGFFYCLKGFWLARKVVNLGIGIFSIVLGVLAIGDYFKYKHTGMTESTSLQLPKAVKTRIQAVITGHLRQPKQAGRPENRQFFALIFATFTTGFLVSILEAVCTGQTYLPTISFILKTTQIRLAAICYLILYNLMFVVPLLIIFILALLGFRSSYFAGVIKKHFLTTKVLMAVLFFGLGIFIIWRG